MNISELKKEFDYLVEEGWDLHDLRIIAPYPTDSFFNDLVKHFNPKNNLHLYVDDGWPEFKVEKIKETLLKIDGLSFGIDRITSDKGGLVHAKIYFFKWYKPDENNPGKSNYLRHILIGSANPSLSGFGKNAETYALIWRGDINSPDGENQFRIEKEYFSKLAKDGYCSECRLEIGRNSWISLPEIRKAPEKLSSFDAWLQRGYLCHKFEPAANFGKFVIKTIKPIPTLAAFQSAGLQNATASTQITDQYTAASSSNQTATHWKSKYFVETIYGHWTSEDCYQEKKGEFFASGADSREKEIDAIKKMRDCVNEQDSFIKKLESAASLLGNLASDYLQLDKHKKVDAKYYSGICSEKFEKDKRMAMDETFARRYIDGYAFPSFPTIDETSFEEFALSFCDEILLEISKGNTQNKIAKVLIDIGLQCSDAEGLLCELRNKWKKYSVQLTNYFK